MKKSILTIVLAALMLIGFTACEQAVYKVPTGLSVTATRTGYLTGEPIDINTISGTLEYSDGSTRSISGSELSIVSGSNAGAGTGVYTVSYGNLVAILEVTEYEVADITSLAISDLPATVEAEETSVEVEGVATLPNGDTSNVDVTLTINALTQVGATAEPTISTYTVGNGTVSKDKVTGTDDWQVTVVSAGEFDITDIKTISVTYVNTTTPDAAAGTYYVDDVVTYKVWGTDNAGNTRELTTSEYGVVDGATLPASFTITQTAGTTEYVLFARSNPTIRTATGQGVKAPAGNAWVESVTFEKKADAQNLAATGGTLNVNQLTTYYDVKLVKHGDSASFTPSADNTSITKGTWAANTAASTTVFTPEISVKVGKIADWRTATVNQLTVAGV